MGTDEGQLDRNITAANRVTIGQRANAQFVIIGVRVSDHGYGAASGRFPVLGDTNPVTMRKMQG